MASYKLKPLIPRINWNNPLTKGLIFDMPFFERSGNPNDIARKYSGTNTSGTWNTGPIGSHLILGGTPANVSFNSPITTTAGQPISIQAVFSFTSSTNGTLIGIRNGSSASKWTAMRANGNGAGQINFLHDVLGSGANVDSVTTTFNDGLVHNAVGVYDGNFIILYVDGKFEATSISKPNAALNETGTWRIGRRSDSAAEYVTGKMYVARIWSRGLNSNEVKLLNTDPWRIYRKTTQHFFKSTSSGGVFASGPLTKYTEQEVLNILNSSGEHQYTEQEVANIYAGNAPHSKTLQEVLNGYAGNAPHAKSEQEQLFSNVAANLGFTGSDTKFSSQELLNMAKNSSLTLENVLAGTGFSSTFSATGGDITTSGAYTIHTFNADGTFTPNGSGNVDYLVVAGGGGGASGGGGGGEVLTGTAHAVTAQAYSITVGAGGTAGSGYAGSTVPLAGGNSVFDTITAGGGGRAGTNFSDAVTDGGNGGSGGGGAYSGAGATTGGTGATGGDGGTNGSQGSPFPAGGGGGAGAVGQNAPDTTHGGAGGDGIANDYSGASVTYGGGGGGGVYTTATGGAGGAGGGGAGQTGDVGNGVAGGTNTGGGGGGAGNGAGRTGGAGGSGIVIIRYLT